jgi:hypothetical protein
LLLDDALFETDYDVLSCDLNFDGECTTDDIDVLGGIGPITGGVDATTWMIMDLDSSSTVDLLDRDLWLSTAAG